MLINKNEAYVWSRLYLKPLKNSKMLFRGFKYSINDKVRIARLPNIFSRQYDEKYSAEPYTIIQRHLSQNQPMYKLKAYDNVPVKGRFYEVELVPVDFDPNMLFKIDNVLKTRKRRGIHESFVSWKSWPKHYNSWIPTDSIEDISKN